jgi:UDP-N-acetylglucosamine--N-acetylmuramyl-(pentapeptide) pyrophosphoryl-undecaprenol N-acetylglucosamine transferase
VTSAAGPSGTMAAQESLRVVIAGGGTGGHLFPGIAVAREIQSRVPGARVSFVGTSHGIEARVVPLEGFALDLIRSRGIKGKSISARLQGVAVLPLSLFDAWRALSNRRPQLVIGVGGYSSGPVVLVAAARRTPTMLLEQNAVPGLTNRLLAPFSGAVAVSFESTRALFGAKAFVSGNPVRPEFLSPVDQRMETEKAANSRVRLLVFGGSQGAHAINMAMMEAAAELVARVPDLRVTHQTGVRDLEMVREAYRKARVDADVAAFFDDMPKRLAETDLIVCRAGATTLAEVTAAGRPAILVPFPGATDDHQRTNAETLAAAGAAEMLIQADMTGYKLADRIVALANDAGKRDRMSAAARRLSRPDAARVIVDRALALIEDKTMNGSRF